MQGETMTELVPIKWQMIANRGEKTGVRLLPLFTVAASSPEQMS
jgi:hypothetical protein